MKRNVKVLAGLMAATVIAPWAPALAYHASSDTGADALDYIENERRMERENRLTEDQKALVAAAEEMQKHLRYPWNPKDTSKPAPLAFEGDDLTYDERDGSFLAKGKVHIMQADAHSYDSEDISGNLVTHDVYMPEKSHLMQMTPGQARVTLDGYKAHYNYMTKLGSMEDVKGKVNRYYITGKRFEFYPDHYVVYDGTATKCGAQKPDYNWRAAKMTIYPGKKLVMEDMKFQIKGKTIYKRKRYISDISEEGQNKKTIFPRIGYDSDDGWWIRYKSSHPLASHIDLNTDFRYFNRAGWRSNYNITWSNAHMQAGVIYGHFKDSDNNWIKKMPSFFWRYSRHVRTTPFTYSLDFERGKWYNKGIHSVHSEYDFRLARDTIKWNGWRFDSSIGYSITTEGCDHSWRNGLNADAVLSKEFNPRWAAYVGAHYRTQTRQNSVFDYDLDDYHKRLDFGVSYRLTDRDRFMVSTRYNVDDGAMNDIDYYWFHDMHCFQLITRYRSKQNTWRFTLDFTPW